MKLVRLDAKRPLVLCVDNILARQVNWKHGKHGAMNQKLCLRRTVKSEIVGTVTVVLLLIQYKSS